MNSSARTLALRSPRFRWVMCALWATILLKCALVSWAVNHWHMPFHAGWVIVPTLVFAALATAVSVAGRE